MGEGSCHGPVQPWLHASGEVTVNRDVTALAGRHAVVCPSHAQRRLIALRESTSSCRSSPDDH